MCIKLHVFQRQITWVILFNDAASAYLLGRNYCGERLQTSLTLKCLIETAKHSDYKVGTLWGLWIWKFELSLQLKILAHCVFQFCISIMQILYQIVQKGDISLKQWAIPEQDFSSISAKNDHVAILAVFNWSKLRLQGGAWGLRLWGGHQWLDQEPIID